MIGSDPVTMDVAGYNQDGGAGRDILLVCVCSGREYVVLKRGIQRTQAMIRSRQQTARFRQLRVTMVRLQARCRGQYVR